MNAVALINNKPLAIKEFQGHRVITFKDIDEHHERPSGTAKRNFATNKNRFIENVDYFNVKPSDVQKYEFRTFEINNPEVQKHENRVFETEYEIRTQSNRGTILLTESGYLMLAKSLNDDVAWQVQRALVNNYFRAKEMVDIRYIRQLEERLTNLERLGQGPTQIPRTADPVADAFFDVLRQALSNGYYLSDTKVKAPVNPSQKLLGAIARESYYIISNLAYDLYSNAVENPLSRVALHAYLSNCGYLTEYPSHKKHTHHRRIKGNGYSVLLFNFEKVKL